MKLLQIVNMIESLVIMTTLPLSAKDSFYLNNILIKFDDEINSYNNTKNNLLIQYGESDNGINYILNNEENQKLFYKELCELDNIEIDVTIQKIKVGLSKLDKLGEIETRHLYNLKDIIEFYDDTIDV